MRSFQRLLGVAVLSSLGFALPTWAGSVGAAKSRIAQAQEYLEKNQKDEATDKLTEAEKFLDGLTDAEKAPLVKQIAELRAKLGSSVDPEVSGRIERNIGRLIGFAEGEADSNAHNAGDKLDNAAEALNADDAKKNLNPVAREKLQARIDALRTKLAGANTNADTKRFIDRVERNLRSAKDAVGYDPRFARTRIDEATSLLASDEAKTKLDAKTIKQLEDGVAEAEAKLGGATKKDAMNRATPDLEELEKRLATDPFKGLDQYSAYKVSQELNSLQSRVTGPMKNLPEADSDRKAYDSRMAAAQKKIDAYDAAWSSANVEAAVGNRWKFALQGLEGWEKESTAAPARPFEKPKLDDTAQAERRIKFFLEDKDTVAVKPKLKDLPEAAATIAEAEKTLATVQAKLDAAFNLWMDAAEKQPRPQGTTRFAIGSANEMTHWVDDHLAGSKYQSADVARAKKLDDKWKAELAAIKRQHEAALEKLTAQADAAWPKIVASIPAQDGFHPSDADSLKGKTFRFKSVRNRTGWDFDGRYDLVIWVDGQPVAGTYAPKINEAFANASAQIGDIIEDHQDWDIIAVVEGRGQAQQRYTTEVKDQHMNVLGKIEGTHPIDCVLVRVIAVHAGPVAVSTN